jgi:hypothetical protein
LTKNDIPEVAAYFSKESSLSEEVVTNVCEQILEFTNGQLFPFVKIMEHLLDPESKIDLSDTTPYLNSKEFRDSAPYNTIKCRCFQFSGIIQSATNILSNIGTVGDFSNLEKMGLIINGVFASQFIMNEVFLMMPPPKKLDIFELDYSDERKSFAEQVICAGLHHITYQDFKDLDGRTVAVENAISMKWGCYVTYALPNVRIYFQARTMYEDHKGPGAKPLIDFVFNGELNLGVEVALNLDAKDIKGHLDRFKNKYKVFLENGVVLHIDTESQEPVLIEPLEENEILNNKIYTFLVDRNVLYRGSTLIQSNVARKLRSELIISTSENASSSSSKRKRRG